MEEKEYTGLGRWLQSKFVLGTARKIYLVIASLSLLVAILAAIAVLLFQLWAFKPASEVAVPEARAPQPVSLDATTVAQSLVPPKNIRLVVHPITAPLGANDIVGYFEADTPNGLASFPNDFDIFGGPDAAQFERAPVNVQYGLRTALRAGLRPSATLMATLNQAFSGSSAQQQKSFSVTVVARDRFGNATRPTSISFTIAYGPAPETPQGAVQVTDLQQIARAIALHLDPSRTPVYFDQYRHALRVPRECGAADNNADFIRGFGQAFNQLKPQLSLSNIEPFYAGVCAAWTEGVAKETANQQTADSARNEAMAKNMAARATDAISKMGVNGAKYTALSVVIGAISAFLFISLFLAFLAIENHSDALRQAVQALADRKRD
jgi:hypothetical protein